MTIVTIAADESHALLMTILDAEAPSGAWYLGRDSSPDVDIAPLLGPGGQEMVYAFLDDGEEFTDQEWREHGSGEVKITVDQAQSLVECLKYELVDLLDTWQDYTSDTTLTAQGIYDAGNGIRINMRDAENGYQRLLSIAPRRAS
jgi:hypothetical protein